MVLRLVMLIACCWFCSLLLFPVLNDSDCTENASQPCCYGRLLMGYDFLLCNTARQGRLLLCSDFFLGRKSFCCTRAAARHPELVDRRRRWVCVLNIGIWVSSLFFHSLTLWEIHSAQAACCLN